MGAVVDRILEEYELRKAELGEEPSRTLYFGGGTPSILPPELFERLAEGLYRIGEISEFTIEVNPEDVSKEITAHWRACGVNRVSMGIQSFIDDELNAVGRRHTGEDALNAIDTLREGGIENLSCDLIYGLPGQTAESWARSIDLLLRERPEHVSAYCLTYEPGTRLTRRLEAGLIEEASEALVEKMYSILCEKMRSAGYEHYEISNFARQGYRSKHNSGYWTGQPYLGLGPGAHSLDKDGVRRFNPSDVRAYTAANEPFPICIIDEEDETARLNDILITALRTSEGLHTNSLPAHLQNELLAGAESFIRSGELKAEGCRLYIPEEAMLRSDSILRELLFDNSV